MGRRLGVVAVAVLWQVVAFWLLAAGLEYSTADFFGIPRRFHNVAFWLTFALVELPLVLIAIVAVRRQRIRLPASSSTAEMTCPLQSSSRSRWGVATIALLVCTFASLTFFAIRVTREVGIVAPDAIPKTDGQLASLFSSHAVFFERYDSPHGGEFLAYGSSTYSSFESFAVQSGLDFRPEGGSAFNHLLAEGISAFFSDDDPTFEGELKLGSGRSVQVDGAMHPESGETVVRIKF